ncbi:MAG: hypothetical protein LBL65_06895 [Campylobacteraceae bacterium]|nr:hypothetical protein [Campylobacteraceae bacterium]
MKDFNSLFWGFFGIKHRVYGIEDIIFEISDKKAKQKEFERFINSPI